MTLTQFFLICRYLEKVISMKVKVIIKTDFVVLDKEKIEEVLESCSKIVCNSYRKDVCDVKTN